MASYIISSFCNIFEKLKAAGIQISEIIINYDLELNSLPNENFCRKVEWDEIPSIKSLKAKLIEEEVRQLECNNHTIH